MIPSSSPSAVATASPAASGRAADQARLDQAATGLHLLGEAQGAGEVDVHPRREDECAAPAGAFESQFANELAQRAPDGDQAAAIAEGEVALGRQAIAGSPFARVEGRLQVEK